MGGNVTVKSKLGHGAEFKIKLGTKTIQTRNNEIQESSNDFVFISK